MLYHVSKNLIINFANKYLYFDLAINILKGSSLFNINFFIYFMQNNWYYSFFYDIICTENNVHSGELTKRICLMANRIYNKIDVEKKKNKNNSEK